MLIVLTTLLTLFVLVHPQKPIISAELSLTQYDPITLYLNFSTAVPRPVFQILLNNNYNLPVQQLTPIQNTPAAVYTFQVNVSGVPAETLQTYVLLFNDPLNEAYGRLNASCYTLTAAIPNVIIPLNNGIGIAIAILSYFAAHVSILGSIFVQFVQIFALFVFRSSLTSTLYQQIIQFVVLVPPNEASLLQNQLQIRLVVPLVIILVSFMIGFIINSLRKRKTATTGQPNPTAILTQTSVFTSIPPQLQQQSILTKIITDLFCYDLFLTFSTYFVFTISYNSLQTLNYLTSGNGRYPILFGMSCYLSLLTTLSIVYLHITQLNPYWGQSEASWQRRLLSTQFRQYHKLHDSIQLRSWYTRNTSTISLFKRLLVVILFFSVGQFECIVLLIQFLHLFFTFTVRPYKQQLYVNGCILFRLLMFLFYTMVVLGNLYFTPTDLFGDYGGSGKLMLNYGNARVYIMVRQATFMLILLIMIVGICYQLYHKCSSLKYEISLFKDQHLERVKIINQDRCSTYRLSHKDRLSIADSHQDDAMSLDSREVSRRQSMSNNKTTGFKLKESERSISPTKGIPRSRNKNSLKSNSNSNKKLQLEIEMSEINRNGTRARSNSKITDMSNPSQSPPRKKRKWNQRSLLQDIVSGQ